MNAKVPVPGPAQGAPDEPVYGPGRVRWLQVALSIGVAIGLATIAFGLYIAVDRPEWRGVGVVLIVVSLLASVAGVMGVRRLRVPDRGAKRSCLFAAALFFLGCLATVPTYFAMGYGIVTLLTIFLAISPDGPARGTTSARKDR